MRLFVLQMAINEQSGSPVPAYLIQTDDGSNVLIDTGFPRAMVGAYARPGGSPTRMDEEHYIVNALAALGVVPANIRYLVITHLDHDHAGALDAFPDAELVIQREAYEAARGGLERYGRTRDQWSNPTLHFRLVDGDTILLPGVELIAASGHAPGVQASSSACPRPVPSCWRPTPSPANSAISRRRPARSAPSIWTRPASAPVLASCSISRVARVWP